MTRGRRRGVVVQFGRGNATCDMNNDHHDITVLVLEPNSPRRGMWEEFFGGTIVPVTREEACPTLLPGHDEAILCFFVNFYILGQAGYDRLVAVNEKCKGSMNHKTVAGMLAQNIYPIIWGNDLVVVTGPRRMWNERWNATNQ